MLTERGYTPQQKTVDRPGFKMFTVAFVPSAQDAETVDRILRLATMDSHRPCIQS
jgi:hypothetical protein